MQNGVVLKLGSVAYSLLVFRLLIIFFLCSSDRYQLLQRQWILHAFDHAVKKWGWHSDRL